MAFPAAFLRRHLAAAALVAAAAGGALAGGPDDMHFRPFGIEPADRVDWGHGHLVAGVDRETRPEPGTERRTTLPLEATIGLPAGFSAVLGVEGLARTRLADGSAESGNTREALLKYALPAQGGLHLAVFTGLSRKSGEGNHDHSLGASMTLDTEFGDIGAGFSSSRKRPNEPHGGREAGINWFRRLDSGWAFGAELRRVHGANDEKLNHWLAGVGRVVGRGVLLDAALGGVSGSSRGRRLTFGISYFY
ncbi:MAG: hypothetical protein OEL88_03275 [Sterolibacteriaceae bacterium MAG5]|nr:hypothetical protein [Candidatus Nitricoxidireducens bremensis]